MPKSKIRHKKPKKIAVPAPAQIIRRKRKPSAQAIAGMAIVTVVAIAMVLTVILPIWPMH